MLHSKDAHIPNNIRRALYNSSDKKEESSPNTKRKILYNSSDHHIIDIGNITKIQKKEQLTNSRGNIVTKPLNKSYKVVIESEESSEEVKIKSDTFLFYDSDGFYNTFELRIICQQIKCTGHKNKNSFAFIMDNYKGIRCEDGSKSYLILSKNISVSKNVPFVKKYLPLSMTPEQSSYYPIYIICEECELYMCEFEILFPYFMYNLLNH